MLRTTRGSLTGTVSPIVEIALHCGERGKVLRQHPPLTPGPCDVQDRVQHGSQVGVARPAQRLGRRHLGLDQRPFGIRDIACVAVSLAQNSCHLPDGWDKETPTSPALTGPGLVQCIFSAPPRPSHRRMSGLCSCGAPLR